MCHAESQDPKILANCGCSLWRLCRLGTVSKCWQWPWPACFSAQAAGTIPHAARLCNCNSNCSAQCGAIEKSRSRALLLLIEGALILHVFQRHACKRSCSKVYCAGRNISKFPPNECMRQILWGSMPLLWQPCQASAVLRAAWR